MTLLTSPAPAVTVDAVTLRYVGAPQDGIRLTTRVWDAAQELIDTLNVTAAVAPLVVVARVELSDGSSVACRYVADTDGINLQRRLARSADYWAAYPSERDAAAWATLRGLLAQG